MSFATRSTASAFASTSTPVSRFACSRPVSRSVVVRAQPDTQPAVGGGEKISNTAPAAQEKDTKQTEKPAGSGAGWVQPTLNPDTPSPIFGGSTGGLLRKAQVEEFYVVTWEAKKEAIFEMPTGGAATMRAGANLLKLARKEQCMALTGQLRTKFKIAPCFYRVYPDGKVEYLHPKDGVYPEKVNPGRPLVNCNMRSIGENVNPIKTKFTGKGPMSL